jgi:deoxyribonuclease IV
VKKIDLRLSLGISRLWRLGGMTANNPRFGPAGVPPYFRMIGAELADVPKLLREEGLDAFEYQASRWGQKPQMQQEIAQSLGVEARKHDVLLSMHGSYFINLLGSEEIVEASKRRLLAAATAAQWMGAYVVVFHLGFYGQMLKSEAMKKAVPALKDVVARMNNLGIHDVKLGPETMGKHTQFGNLQEILTICHEVSQTQLVLDWSHIHARGMGSLRKPDSFRAIVEEVEKQLGPEALKNMHCHFSKIEFTIKGERRHHSLDEIGFGPDFGMLAQILAEIRLSPVIVCESPLLDIDALKMQKMFTEAKERLK